LVNLAGAIIGRPALVFLDEPTAGLDPHARRAVWALIAQLREAGVAVVLTTHAMDEAEQLADQVVLLDAGRVVAAGTVPELTAQGSLEELFLRLTSPAQTLAPATPTGASARQRSSGSAVPPEPTGGRSEPTARNGGDAR
ncbi:MAG: AAA family ATPase, partial [Propionicimonas sp.]|nr:AAA family ATPase [Propionicimonas sp.]